MDPQQLVERARELRRRIEEARAELIAIIDAAEEKDRGLNDEEQATEQRLNDEMESLEKRAARMEAQAAAIRAGDGGNDDPPKPGQRIIPRPEDGGVRSWDEWGDRADAAPTPERRSEILGEGLREFTYLVMFKPQDQRLSGLWRDVEHRQADQSMGVPAAGGFAVPEVFRREVLLVEPEDAVVRPRAQVIPAGNPPDGVLHIPALDQSANLYGGVEVTWIEEGDVKPQTDYALRRITLEPHELAAHIVITDKLLRNWEAAAAFTADRLRDAVTSAEELAFIMGTGVGQPQGWIGHAGTVVVPRATAGTVEYVDLVTMDEVSMGPDRIWIGSSRVKGQLRAMEDTGGSLIWQDSARPGAPPTLIGYPFIEYNRAPTLGTEGDLSLVSLENYLIKDGSGPFVAFSEHVHFITNRTVVKIFTFVDGSPWLTGPLTMDNGDTVSPFVVLGDAVP